MNFIQKLLKDKIHYLVTASIAIKIIRVGLTAILYWVASLFGAFFVVCADMKICEENKIPYLIANSWLVFCFILDVMSSFTRFRISNFAKPIILPPISVVMYGIILLSLLS